MALDYWNYSEVLSGNYARCLKTLLESDKEQFLEMFVYTVQM